MPVNPAYQGAYIQESIYSVRTITCLSQNLKALMLCVKTSLTLFSA
jgi:hypothetical protein